MSIIKRLSASDINSIIGEIPNVSHLWGNHYKGNPRYIDAALKDGVSVWIHEARLDDIFLLDNELPFLSSLIRKLGNEIKPNTKFGRVYFYKLPAGVEIYEHEDRDQYYYTSKRYHIYLNVPAGLIINHSGPTIESNTLIFFNPLEKHSYKNNSMQDVYFAVFDIYD